MADLAIAPPQAQQEKVIGSLSLVVYADGRAEIKRDGVFSNPTLISDILSRLGHPPG